MHQLHIDSYSTYLVVFFLEIQWQTPANVYLYLFSEIVFKLDNRGHRLYSKPLCNSVSSVVNP
jgi:hypothetical protein